MSMNLGFDTGFPFPVQTPTDLTKAVLKLGTLDEQLKLLDSHFVSWGWDESDRERVLSEIRLHVENGARLEMS